MWSEPVIRAPVSGFDSANSALVAISPGISCSASRISLRPNSASERSATLKSRPAVLGALVAVLIRSVLSWVEVRGCQGYGARMEDGLRVNDELTIPLDEIELRASRSSGPGGQHANVTASRIEAVFDVEASEALSDEQRALLSRKQGDRVTAISQDARSQARNRELALERLREKIDDAIRRPKPR